MKVIIRAPLLSISGYGIHSRQIFEWLNKKPDVDVTADIVKWGMTAWNLNKDAHDGLIGRIMAASKPVEGKYDMSFQVQLPDEWDSNLAKQNIGVSAFVETDRCNPLWIDKCNEMDAVIVPSKFTKTIAKRSGPLETPIYVIPEWYNEKIDSDLNPLSVNLKPKFNFLMIGTVTGRSPDNDRKNLFYGLKWFCEKFKDDKKVGLVLKTSFGKGTTIDRKITVDTIKNILKEVRPGKFPKVNILHGNMTESDIASIYFHKKIQCLLAPTRGEGYGLPIIEAAASGMPVVATGWSGHTDFLKDGYYSKLDYSLKNISDDRVDDRIFMKGTRWANVNEADFKEKIKNVVDNYPMHLENAKSLQKIIKKNFSKSNVIKIYNDFLKNINED
jgi:glycosyltransferase involved in cell wall biosynthesis